jgi:hypothetical protein
MPLQDPLEELALVQKCAAEDEDAWGVLFSEYGAGVRRALRRRLGAWAPGAPTGGW